MEIVPAQAVSSVPQVRDDMLIRMWLHGRTPNTVTAYAADANSFLQFAGRPLAEIGLADLQRWAENLSEQAPASRARRLAVVKSLLSFALKLGYLQIDPGRMLRIEKPAITSGDHLLSPADVLRMIGMEPDLRARTMLRLVYACGLRASEACGLRWRDMTGTDKKGGQANILGKGSKLRTALIPADLWRDLAALTPAVRPDSPVVPGRHGGAMDRQALHRLVKRAVRRAGVNPKASSHWLRHSATSHAIAGGCDIQTVRERLGHASLATTTRYAHAAPDKGLANYLKY
ncbi:tyrosine-type recombinase/integrase [Lichenicola cladoniae]|uniref:Tyrosine-type recombinase/integrase n=1 Tax=Lichenicola cladoniae TaxID=1484109 RepID=A0A6M8HNB3_9PROT|nr:tyrosine-type recombinase/integrase [Lichenicola cladoniae]NPD67281.1 tyrosine-type recombinase/integrase [Acetobacteraceae bacterium]QKE89785.1 tyrosine-type recombinase/integrase [Lichenicola cladoniae]